MCLGDMVISNKPMQLTSLRPAADRQGVRQKRKEVDMTLTITDLKIIERGPYCIVGNYAVCEGSNEPWGEAAAAFDRRRGEIKNRVGDEFLDLMFVVLF